VTYLHTCVSADTIKAYQLLELGITSPLPVDLSCWYIAQCPSTHVYTTRVCSRPLGAEVGLSTVLHPYLLTPPSRAFSAAGHTLLVYDYCLTLGDEVSFLHEMHDVQNMTLAADQVHLERPLDGHESHVPYQPLWKPCWADLHPAGRGRPSLTWFSNGMLQFTK